MNQERPWLANYPKNIPANIDPQTYSSLVDMFNQTFEKYGKKDAFTCMGKSLTFSEIDELSRDFAAYLHNEGLKQGDKIAIMMPNLLQYPIALFGALRAGLVVVNTNPLYTAREMEFQFVDSGVKAVVVAENFAGNLQKIMHNTQIKQVILTSVGEMLGTIKGGVVDFMVRNVKKMVPEYTLPNAVTFKHALKEGKNYSLPKMEYKPEDVILLQYTGGTTGISKAAMLTNQNLVANMLQIRAVMAPFLSDKEQNISLCPLPLYHIFAFSCNCLALMSIGSLNVLVTNARDLKSVIQEFKNHKISLMTGVNTLFNSLLNHSEFASADFSNLKITVGGGMAVQKIVAERWEKTTGCYLSEGYGMTETSPVVSVNPFDGSGIIGSIGIALPSTDMRVIDEDGIVLPDGEIGEIQVKGPQVMLGYYNQPEETKKVLKDGWLSTGDIGKMIERGYYQIVDRKKDMILVSGFNVYPNEIEEVIMQHPKVLEVAAIGIPDANSGESVKVFVVKKDESLTVGELRGYCKENFTGYKIPRQIEFRNELPKTNVGKILRRALKEESLAIMSNT